ncbi:MAG: peptidoglycan DD-metalloendopeptidase family protein, partial [Nocardioidaceae bacterium]
RLRRFRVAMVLAVTGSFLTAAVVSPTTVAAAASHHHQHQLQHKKHRLDTTIKARSVHLDEISQQLLSAQARVTAATSDLRSARASLSAAQQQVHVAQTHDLAMQAKLDFAKLQLTHAQQDLVTGREAVASERADMASYAVADYATGGADSLSFQIAFTSGSPTLALNAVQGAASIQSAQSMALQSLQANQVLLRLTKQRVQRSKNQVAAARQVAAVALADRRVAESRAQAAKNTVASRLADLRTQAGKLRVAKKSELGKIKRMRTVRDRVERHLRRIAQREARASGRRLLVRANGGGYLSYPVAHPVITSPFGMRFNPIIHVWELHDGTDFGVNCGTPVYAAAPGNVTQEYYSSVYGNRIFVSHGIVRGVALWTSYNHLSKFVAHVGEHVRRGQLVAYSGTTGWSTGCHLHFGVYVNGTAVNPMNWL